MPRVARVTDTISHGGSLLTGSDTVRCDGLKVCRIGDSAACNEHGAVTIVQGSAAVKADGIGVARLGDSLSCGATITSGSINAEID